MQAGERIRSRMAELDMNQTELAKRAGLTKTDVTRYINGGLSEPSLSSTVQLGEALELTPSDMAEIYDLWHPKQRTGDKRLDHLESTIDQLESEDRYYILELVGLIQEAASSRLRKASKQ